MEKTIQKRVHRLTIICLCLMLLLPAVGLCQTDGEKSYYKFTKPGFFRERDGLAEYFSERLELKKKDFQFEVTGTFIAVFTLGKDLIIKNLKMKDSTSSPDLNRKLMDWIKISQKSWYAGKINGQPVDVDMMVNLKLIPSSGGEHSEYMIACGYQMIEDPVLTTAFYNIGADEAVKENFGEAIRYFDEALRISPRDIDALFNRGICKYKSGDKPAACNDWNEIHRIGKPDADKLLAKYCQ